MNFITEWVTNIILFILLATVVDMLLPNSTFQKYAKMVAGLLLITVILTPVFKLISSDFEDVFTASAMGQPEQKNMNNSIELKKREIQASLDEYTLNKMAVQLKEDANEELIANYGMEINSIQLSIDKEKDVGFPANLTEMVIHMKDSKDQNNVVEAVSPVRIDTQQPLLDKDESKQMDTESIISFLSEKWEVRDDAIVIMYEGGEDEKNG
ncbi:stage III sporulation protein AF [Niallia circulans]|uniref:Stage III sporulation protein AF n=1 Tax=Niallia circulans TaxID=1397 RepID=A0A941G9L3_NIACI|nr:stage III sporulation protein AF [Niallia circulans]EOR23351.1 stage III sporulation protein AF [Niallia nealsonii AAU1]MCB5235868.1 stage III sporulation protein AF [Niallia circulans]